MRHLLWLDCGAAALGGTLVLLFSGWLSRLYGLPQGLLHFTAGINLLYASYSLSLALRAARPMALIRVLVVANSVWVLVCVVLACVLADGATGWGIAHLVAEACFVGTLARLEWRWRALLLRA